MDNICAHLHTPAPATFITQEWSSYTADNHSAWALLYAKRMETLRETGSHVFLEGAEAIGIGPNLVPNLTEVNQRLAERTGWAAVPVSGFLPAKEFFACLAQRRFPTTVTIRPLAQLDYLPEPDIFHDVFGHVPLHAHPVFADFLQRFGQVATMAVNEKEVEAMARLFWFTVEFGLVKEAGRVKVYGSGLISSHGDASNALSGNCDRRPFSLNAVLSQAFEIDRLQDVLFVVEDYSQLFDAVEEAARMIG